MKDRQARQTGLITPQMQGGQLPMVSPGPQQAQIPNQHTQRQLSQQQQQSALNQPKQPFQQGQQGQQNQQGPNQGGFPQTTPQPCRAQLPQGQLGQMQGQQGPNQGQQAAMMAMQQANQGQGQMQQGNQGQGPAQGQVSTPNVPAPHLLVDRLNQIRTWISGQPNDTLEKGTKTVLQRVLDPSTQNLPVSVSGYCLVRCEQGRLILTKQGKADYTKSALVLLLVEYKKRGMSVGEQLDAAIQDASVLSYPIQPQFNGSRGNC